MLFGKMRHQTDQNPGGSTSDSLRNEFKRFTYDNYEHS